MKRRQGGIAAITAILIVAVAASAASLMLAQQAAMIDQTMLVASRAQADVYAQAGLEWARGILLQDAKTTQNDTLAEGWARPLAGMPLPLLPLRLTGDLFVPVDFEVSYQEACRRRRLA